MLLDYAVVQKAVDHLQKLRHSPRRAASLPSCESKLNHDRLARARRTAASPSRLARPVPPLRGFGLDRGSPPGEGLAKRSRFEMSASAPLIADLPEGTRALADRNRSFACERSSDAAGMPRPRASLAFCLTIFTASRSPGLASGARARTTFSRGSSRTIAPTLFRSPTPSSTCSRHGSAISSMNCSGRADDLRRQSR